MTTPEIPKWRAEPQQVWVNCEKIKESDLPEELIVQFRSNGEHFTSFVPKRFVNHADRRLQAIIVADVEEGLLVDIPAETLTSGPRILVTESEKEQVLTFEHWVYKNGT